MSEMGAERLYFKPSNPILGSSVFFNVYLTRKRGGNNSPNVRGKVWAQNLTAVVS